MLGQRKNLRVVKNSSEIPPFHAMTPRKLEINLLKENIEEN